MSQSDETISQIAVSQCTTVPEDRGRWSSRTAFTVAAVGSAVGLGNLWRYPFMSYEFGGSAFLVPYILSLLLIGVPLMAMELALGQVFQTGDVGCFGKINKRFVGLGVATVWGSLHLASYYLLLLSWAVLSLLRAFEDPVPWSNPEVAEEVFIKEIAGIADDPLVVEAFIWPCFLAMLFCWIFVFLAIFRGVFITGRVTYVTMALPFVLVIILTIAGATLEGADEGIRQYIGKFDVNEIVDTPSVWTASVGQTFFSTSLAGGIMTAYASHNSPNQNCSLDSVIIVAADWFVSFVCGFAVFTVLGFVAHDQGIAFEDLELQGSLLAFSTLPVGLATLPVPQLWIVMLFLTLVLLGIDTSFSMMEAIITPLCDSVWFKNTPRWKVVVWLTVISILLGIPYCLDIGSYILDVVDEYSAVFILQASGVAKAVAVSWFWRYDDMIAKVGAASFWTFFAGFYGGALIALTAGFGVGVTDPATGEIIGPPIFFALAILGLIVSYFLAPKDTENRLYWVVFGCCELARKDINSIVENEPSNWFVGILSLHRLSILWTFLLRFFAPACILLLLVRDFEIVGVAYELPLPYQVVGGLISFSGWAMMALCLVFPDWKFYSGWMDGVSATTIDRFKENYGKDVESSGTDESLSDVPANHVTLQVV